MDAIKKGWYTETNDLWPGQAMSLEVEEVLHQEKSKFQDVAILKTTNHGNVLLLDGVIQLAERDEWAYQEMATHVALNSHPNPEKVLIIGGGDGGVAREADRHPAVKEITVCEIDESVVELSKKYLPTLACGFDSPKLNLFIGDGFDYMSKHTNEFDVIITDSSDPFGPATALFQKSYYDLMKSALRPNGLICSQGETIWLFLDLIKDMVNFCKELFPVVDYTTIMTPTYPCGQLGLVLCSTNPETNFRKPVRTFTDEEIDQFGFKYYNSELHSASFVLPTFAQKTLGL